MVAYLRTLIATTILLVLSACGGGSGNESTFKPSTGADTQAPEIVATTPANNTLSVSDSAAVVIRFNESLKSYSVNFKLIDVASGLAVEGFVNYHDDLKSVIFTPREPLTSETQYQAKLIGAEDLAGNNAEALDVLFTTEAVATQRPNILIQPLAKNLFAGDTIDLRVVLSNLDDATSFTWLRDTSTQTAESLGQFNNNLVIDATLANDSGYYYCKISNASGETQTIPVYVEVKKPLVVGQAPQSVTSLAGRSVTFSAQFSGTENKTLQWYKDDQALEESAKHVGVDESILRVNTIDSDDAGSYYLKATTASASLSTQAATLVVIDPVVISQALENQTIAEQSQLSLNVRAQGTGPLQYSWYRNNVLLDQHTGAQLQLNSVSVSDAGTYKVLVRNAYSSQTTSASVAVLALAKIIQQPVDISLFAGSNANLTVQASGSELSYQWQKQSQGQWQNISSATQAQLTLSNITAAAAGDYRVVVSNELNTVISSTANVYVGQGASISQQPQAQLVQQGQSVSFNVVASGESLQYEWRKNGQLMSGQTTSQLSISNVSAGDQASYQCRVWNSNNSVNCAEVNLTVAQALQITKQPQSTTVFAGDWVNIKVTASGHQASYRWYKNGNLMAGENGQNLSLGSVTANDGASYYAQVYNQYSSIQSATSVVTVKQAVSIISHPSAKSVNAGATLSLSVNAQGSGLSYEWRRAGQLLAGQNSSTLTIANTDNNDAGSYQCRVWNANNSVNCNTANVTVRASVSIASQTNSLSINEGQSTTLSVVANGYQAAYRWYKGNQLIAGANSSQLSLNNIVASDAATYKCEVYNSFSSEQCRNIDLNVVNKPIIASVTPSQQVQLGGSVTLAVTATGSGSLKYQWYKDGAVLAGQTANQLNLNNVQAANLGAYHCNVSNGAGQIDSQLINITGVEAYSVEVSWAKPSQREDGSALGDNEIDGYKVYMQVSSGEFDLIETNLGASNTSTIVANLGPGSYTFKVRTLDSDGQESSDSELQSIDL